MAKPRYSLTRALAAAETQNSPEYENHFALRKSNDAWKTQFNIGSAATKPWMREITVPWSGLSLTRDLSTQSQFSGGFTVGLDVYPEVQKSLRPTSLMMRLKGITVVDGLEGNLVLPRISSGVSPSGGSEIQSLTTGDPAFGAANAGPQRLFASVTFSKQLLAQAAGNESIDKVLTTELLRALSFQVDSQLIAGSGIAGQALGILNGIGLNTFTYGASATWAKIMSAQTLLEQAFVDAENACWLVGTNTANKWRQLLRGTTTAMFALEDDRVGNISAYPTTFIGPTEQSILADFSNVIVGIFGNGVDLVWDPYTKASSGEVVISANLYWQVYLRRSQVFVVSTDSAAQ
jgi:HK97 family phage major capsid protein